MATKLKRKKTDKRDVELRRLRKANKLLRDKLAKACDLALDSADVIEDDGIGVDEEENQDFRDMITTLRAYAKRPEAERHVERQKVLAEKGLAIAVAEVERTGKGYPPANPVADAETNP